MSEDDHNGEGGQSAGVDQEATGEHQPSLARTLASSMWFPVFFVVGFMLFYLVPFHAPAPTNVPVAVVGEQVASSLSSDFQRSAAGSFDITAVPSELAGKRALLDREVVAAYSPGDDQLFVASANGRALTQVLSASFGPVAANGGGELTVTDLAPTAPGDTMGTGLFYLLMAMNIGGYIAVMMLLQATTLSKRTKLLTIAGMGVFATVFCYLVGTGLRVIEPNLWVLPIGFLLTQAVAWTTFGLVPFVKQFIPGVAMGLFVLLSIPSSGGAIPKEMVPPFFQALHSIMPLGQAVDAVRGVLYFDNAGIAGPVTGLVIWFAVGVALVGFDSWRNGRKEAQQEEPGASDEPEAGVVDTDAGTEPMLTGTVSDVSGRAVPGAVITVADAGGTQMACSSTTPAGEYRVWDLPEQYVTVVASAPGCRPAAERVSVHPGTPAYQDFVLHGLGRGHSRAPAEGPSLVPGAVPPA